MGMAFPEKKKKNYLELKLVILARLVRHGRVSSFCTSSIIDYLASERFFFQVYRLCNVKGVGGSDYCGNE